MNKYVEWIKSNWFSIILLIAVCLLTWRLFFSLDNYNFILNENKKQSELFHKQLKEIEKTNEQLKINQENLQKKYEEDIQNIMNDYNQKIDKLYIIRKNSQIKIINDTKENPLSLTKKIEDTFGIPSE